MSPLSKTKSMSLAASILITGMATGLATSLISANAWSAPKAVASGPVMPVSVVSACTSDEKWMPENRFSGFLQSRIALSRKGDTEAMSSIIRALKTSDTAKDPHSKLLVQYWMARSLYDLKLVHLAQETFLSLVKQPDTIEKYPDGHAIRVAAMQCLVQIHRNYPTLALDGDAEAAAFRYASNINIPQDQRSAFYEGLKWQMIKRFSTPAGISDSDYQKTLAEFSGSPYFSKLAAILRSSHDGNEVEVLKNESIFADAEFKKRPETEQSLLHLLFGQAYFGIQQWDKSVAHMKAIPNTSNEVVDTFPAIAWAKLYQDKQEDAIGAASNLVMGGLAKTFNPEGYETLSIALSETCNFTEALQTYQHFRKIYGKSYHFLEEMQKGNTATYPLLTRYLTGKSNVPNRVGIQWTADPVFLANQSEINLFIDETTTTLRLQRFAVTQPAFTRSQSWKPFNASLQASLLKAPPRKQELIKQIDVSLAEKNREMFAQVTHTAQNLQLMEAEDYEALGDKILAENLPPEEKAKKDKNSAARRQTEGATWDWGRYPASANEDDENAETWEDELGYLRAKIKNNCR